MNKLKDTGETGLAAQLEKLGAGGCDASGLASKNTDFGGGYSFTGLAAGTYCVAVEREESCGSVSWATAEKEVTIELRPGQEIIVSFGFLNRSAKVNVDNNSQRR